MGADLSFISRWEMSKISFPEGWGEAGCSFCEQASGLSQQAGSGLIQASKIHLLVSSEI